MKNFSSLAAVIGLWLGVSFFLWASYRIYRLRDQGRQLKLIRESIAAIGEATSLVREMRLGGDNALGEHAVRDRVRALLNSIETQSAFFERVALLKKRVQRSFGVEDFQPLSDILQIRRDFWAASEVLLMEDARSLGPEFSDEASFEAFRSEAITLLFGPEAGGVDEEDPVELRLAIAQEEVTAFLADASQSVAVEREENRLPRPSEIIAVPLRLAQAFGAFFREARYLIGDVATSARAGARAIGVTSVKGAAVELRRARDDLGSQFAGAFERAGGVARKGGEGLKRHYEFLLEAQELRARYAEALARAPDLSEKGKQFLKRLELEKRAEQLRAGSRGALAILRRALVLLIAHLIAGLQRVQAVLTPTENKQLVPLNAQAKAESAPRPAVGDASAPIRAQLPPPPMPRDARGRGRPHARPQSRSQRPGAKPREAAKSEPVAAGAEGQPVIRLRDLVTGRASPDDIKPSGDDVRPGRRAATSERTEKPAKARVSHAEGLSKTSFKDLLRGAEVANPGAATSKKPKEDAGDVSGLLSRLSSLDKAVAAAKSEARANAVPPDKDEEGKEPRFRLFKRRGGR